MRRRGPGVLRSGSGQRSLRCNRGVTYVDFVKDVSQKRWTPAGWRITGLNAVAGTRGAEYLTLRKVDSTTAAVWVQGLYSTSGHPPRAGCQRAAPQSGCSRPRRRCCVLRQRAQLPGADRRCLPRVRSRPLGRPAAQPGQRDDGVGQGHSAPVSPQDRGMSCIADSFEAALAPGPDVLICDAGALRWRPRCAGSP